MNIQLVESLVQIIQSLSPEEQKLLKSQLKQTEEKKDNWEEVLEEIEASKQKDLSVRQGKKLSFPLQKLFIKCEKKETNNSYNFIQLFSSC